MSPALEYPTEGEIHWLFDQGVPDTAMLEPTPIRAANVVFLDGNTFDFDSCGVRTFIFKEPDSDDLVAWNPMRNALATWRGAAFAHGQDAVFNPATYFDGGALHVHETPLQWLHADRQGIVILRHDLCHAYLGHCQRLACSDTGLAKKVKAWLQPRKPTVKILVEAQAEKAEAA
jgi:hypothetical protein